MEAVLEERVDKLEYTLELFMSSTNQALLRMENGIRNLQMENRLLSKTLGTEAKRLDETLAKQHKQFEEDMKARHEQFTMEMKARDEQFTMEMKARDEQFKMDMKKIEERMNKKWENLVKKMGTLVEDIVAPSIERLAFELFGFERIDFFGVRVKKTKVNDRSAANEFDVIAVGEDKVILNETKTRPTSEYIKKFIDFVKNDELFEYFPEYKEKKLIPIFSTLYMPADVVKRLTKKRIFAMGMSDSVMTILNFDQCRSRGLKPKTKT